MFGSLSLSGAGLEKDGQHHMVSKTRGIITLYRHQKAAFAITSKRGPTPKAQKTTATELPPGSTISPDNDEVQRITVTISECWLSCFYHFCFVPFRGKGHFLFKGEAQNSP